MPDPDHKAPAPSEMLGPPKITITLNKDDTIAVSGPINDEVLVYGMLKRAEYAIFMHNHPWLAKPKALIPDKPPFEIPLRTNGT